MAHVGGSASIGLSTVQARLKHFEFRVTPWCIYKHSPFKRWVDHPLCVGQVVNSLVHYAQSEVNQGKLGRLSYAAAQCTTVNLKSNLMRIVLVCARFGAHCCRVRRAGRSRTWRANRVSGTAHERTGETAGARSGERTRALCIWRLCQAKCKCVPEDSSRILWILVWAENDGMWAGGPPIAGGLICHRPTPPQQSGSQSWPVSNQTPLRFLRSRPGLGRW